MVNSDTSPCPWPIDTACFGDEWDEFDPDVQDRAIALAVATLRRLTAYRVGGCPITVRPCKMSCRNSFLLPSYYDMLRMGNWGVSGFWPFINSQGLWVNSCGCLNPHCSCTQLCEIELPPPVGPVYAVNLDGVQLDPSEYRVDGTSLVYLGPEDPCPFPTCQDLTKPDTEPDTFSVTYLNGYPVDALGAYAAGVLALQFALACAGSLKCRLPPNVTAVTRQGVSFTVTAGSFPNGMTGIREVDAFIGMWNPNNMTQMTNVWSPDIERLSPRVVATAWPQSY